MKEPKVLTRMRLCECWGDSLDIEEIKEVNNYIENLQRETQKLEKQLEQGKEQYNDLVKEKEELKTLYDSTILEKENQQKEFIAYLENEISEFKKISVRDLEAALVKESHIKLMEEILSKYKEIIGDKE